MFATCLGKLNTSMNLYEELELPRTCTFDEIKQQYRHLANIHHPDKGGDTEKFKRIKFAYEVLSDPDRRKLYDETNTTRETPNAGSEAISQLANVFFSVIANIDLHTGNLIETMRNEINGELLRNNLTVAQCNQQIVNLNVAKQKLIHKNPQEENLLLGFLETHLSIRNNDLKTFSHRKETLEHMVKLLEDYQYGFIELAATLPDMQ
jgi:curved DNA-binding protein CbpA